MTVSTRRTRPDLSYDVGAIKSSPQHIIREGTDPRFLREIKQELRVFEIKSGACLRERLESELRR